MSLNILAIPLTLSAAAAAGPVELGVGLSEPVEANKPSLVVRVGQSWVQGEASFTRNMDRSPTTLTQVLTSVSGETIPEDRTHFQLKALADFGLPAQEQGWSGSPHLYAGAQAWRGQQTLVFPMVGSDPVNTVQADPAIWRLSPLLGAGISASYQRFTARLTVHSTAAPKIWGDGVELHHHAGVDLLIRL